MDAIYEALAENLRAWRQFRGVSQSELAERCGIGRATIASIEGCRQAVALHQVAALAKALEVPLVELIERPGDEFEHLRGVVADEDLQKILDMSKGLR